MDNLPHRPAEEAPRPRKGQGRLFVLLGLLVVAAGSAWGAYVWHRGTPRKQPPPPTAARGPRWLNTRPGVGYVGTDTCAECHAAEALSYAEHPMGRSVRPAGARLPGQAEAPASFTASGLRYAVEREGGAVVHREFVAGGDGPPPAELRAEVTAAVGSGRQGQSFLVERDGRLFQSPISWYVAAKSWKLSPGFAAENKHFSRTIPEACLLCHAQEARAVPDTINRYQPAPVRLASIGCERCHGPGELHVAARRRGDPEPGDDRTIINPGRLSPPLREAVCEQCHLQGEARIVAAGRSLADYRPGLPLEEFVTVFVLPPGQAATRKAVSHVEQMHQSRCFRASDGALGCTSCHDPHALPAEERRAAWYRGRCLSCHRESSCSLPVQRRRRHSPADSCIDCHMPRGDSSNIAHTSITNHRIVRRPDGNAAEGEAEYTLVPFHPGVLAGGEARARRDLGLALAEKAAAAPDALRRPLARRACELLGPAVERAPDDVAALEALGQALWQDQHPREALAALDRALEQAPRRELALGTAALVALELGRAERSIDYGRRLLDVDPWTWQGHAYLGQALALRRQWADAADACERALRLNPFEPRTRMLRIDCLAHAGRTRQARDEFRTLLALGPTEPDKLRKWFDEVMAGEK